MNKKLQATHEGHLRIIDKILPCAVLEDGTRVISDNSVFVAFNRTQRGAPRGGVSKKQRNLPSFIDANNLQPYMDKDFLGLAQLIEYLDKNNRVRKGYKAEILPALCDVYLQARNNNKLVKSQLKLADISEIMVRSLAKIGITALIDEATGYQNVRSEEALQVILEKYLLKEFAPWSKKFPDDFYIEMFRLKKWDINQSSFTKRPSVVGTYTNNIVYDRLAPHIRKELENLNPKDIKGNRKSKHHQFLTEDIGHPALSQHLHTVIHFMKAATGWEDFKRMLQQAFPKKHEQILLDIRY